MMLRALSFEHHGRFYRLEIEDYGDRESSDTVEIFGPDDIPICSYDTCQETDAGVIAEARHEIGAT
jgi:hypothetical protein